MKVPIAKGQLDVAMVECIYLSLKSLVLPGLNLASIPELFPDEHFLLFQALRVLLDLQGVLFLQFTLGSLHVLALQ